jgi:putative hemolysin
MDRIDHALLDETACQPPTKHRYSLGFARDEAERREAQRLRWKVFAEEMGARLTSREPGIDHDIFDPFCEHLIVRDERSREVIGTYRLLSPESACRIGCYYSDQEFDLTRLRLQRDRMVEAGRSCIHPAHRNGAVIALLWSGLARYMLRGGYGYLAGCASMSMADGGHGAAAAYERLRAAHLAPVEYRVFPRSLLPLDKLDSSGPAEPPPLLKGYLRAGAWICGEPAWDPEFNTADFFVLLPFAQLAPRYARHFLGTPSGDREASHPRAARP